jgi:hypothetical protein
MTRAVRLAAVVVAALWAGLLFTLGFVVAPYLFGLAARQSPVVPHSGVAAELIGPLLRGADMVSLAAGAGLFLAVVYLRVRGAAPWGARYYCCEGLVLLGAACGAINHWAISPGVMTVRTALVERYGAFHQADKADPLYGQFSRLHWASTALFVAALAAALVVLICLAHGRRDAAA